MDITLKYYSFTDPITGATTKMPGWEVFKKGYRVHVAEVDGVPKILQNEEVDQHIDFKPKFGSPKEITKEEYDALDTTGESETIKQQRIKATLAQEKWAIYSKRDIVQVSPAQQMADTMASMIAARGTPALLSKRS